MIRIGVFKSLIAFLLKMVKLLSIYSIAVEGGSLILFHMSNSGVDFLPIELSKGDKTTSWLESDYAKITKF